MFLDFLVTTLEHAPFLIASATKLCPSFFFPFIAIKRFPFLTSFEFIETPRNLYWFLYLNIFQLTQTTYALSRCA